MARNIAERNTWIDIHRYIHEKRSLEMAGGVLGDDEGGWSWEGRRAQDSRLIYLLLSGMTPNSVMP